MFMRFSVRFWGRTLPPALLMLLVVVSSFTVPGALLPSPMVSTDDKVLQRLHAKHPRLYATDEEWAGVRRRVEQDAFARGWYERLHKESLKVIDDPPVEYKLTPRLLKQSRTALHRISLLAGLYRLDGDAHKARRARAEMLAAASFKDWNPAHFLDTAEMTNALAIGYDWLFDYLSPEDRSIIRRAIIEKGLEPGRSAYAGGAWWSKTHNNWNQVCNAGLTVGALAVADEEPELAGEIINRARESIVNSMRMFAPDGGNEEGPGYWEYATRYNVFYLAALKSALGTDFSFQKVDGFADTGLFRIHSTGPFGLCFNYADAVEKVYPAPQMLWFAREFQQPAYRAHELLLARERPDFFHLLWYVAQNPSWRETELPRDTMFRAVNVAFFRSAWNDPQGTYVAFKGGSNQASHGHLDLGSFVLDALGERWAVDLGPDDYQLPGYFGKERWNYYRTRTEGHNTLNIDGENQNLTGDAPLIAFLSTPQKAFAVLDLTTAYQPKVTSATRAVIFLNRKQLLVQDELQAPKPVDIAWSFHTRAAVELHGARAVLSRGNAQMQLNILSPQGAQFEVGAASSPPPQKQQPDVRKILIKLRQQVKDVRVAVLLSPAGSAHTPPVEPLEKLIAEGKLKR